MDDALSEAELDAMEARAAAASPGPWTAFVEGRDHRSGDDFIRTAGGDSDAPDMYVSLAHPPPGRTVSAGPNDLDFIAAAREDIPRLVREVRALRERLQGQ